MDRRRNSFWLRVFGIVALTLTKMACSSQEQLEDYYTHELVRNNTISFRLDSLTMNVSQGIDVYLDSAAGKQYLVYPNKWKPSVLFFDIESQSLYKELLMGNTKSGSVVKPTGVKVQSWDSIYLIEKYQYRISMMDSSGVVKRTYNLLGENGIDENTGLVSTLGAPAVSVGEKLFFVSVPDRNPFHKNYYDAKANSALDLNTGKYHYLNNYPAEMRDNVWGIYGMGQFHTYNGKLIISSFPKSDSIRVWNPADDWAKSYYAGSLFNREGLYPYKGEIGKDEKYVLDSFFYRGIVYDPFRNVYYRFAWHKVRSNDGNQEAIEVNDKPISAIILDANFEIIGETILPERQHIDYMYFVGKDGLYLANSNYKHPDYDESRLDYSCYQLQRK